MNPIIYKVVFLLSCPMASHDILEEEAFILEMSTEHVVAMAVEEVLAQQHITSSVLYVDRVGDDGDIYE